MKWFKRRRKALMSPDDVALLLLKSSSDIVKVESQALERHLSVEQRSQLPTVELELVFFFGFALDYWVSNTVPIQEERRNIREALSYHWGEMFGGGHEGQAVLDRLQERFIAYAQIVNEAKDDFAKLFGFGTKLSEFCGMPGNPFLMLLAADLFTDAMKSVGDMVLLRRGS